MKELNVKELSLGLAVTLGAIANAPSAHAQTDLPVAEAPLPASSEVAIAITPTTPPIAAEVAPTAELGAIEFSTPVSIPALALMAPPLDLAVPSAATSNPLVSTPEYSRAEYSQPGMQTAKQPVPTAIPDAVPVTPAAINAQPTIAQAPTVSVPAAVAPTDAPVPAPGLPEATPQERIQQLEQQQQQLKQELEQLKQQIKAPTPEAATTIPAREDQPAGLTFSTSVLFLKPHVSSGMDYAIVDPGVALATSGRLASVTFERSDALRFALGYRVPQSPWDVGVTYTNYNTQGSDSAARPGFPINPKTAGFLLSTLTVPFQNDRADTASARASLQYDTTDLDVGYNFRLGKGLNTRLFAGWRFGNLERDLAVNYNGQTFRNALVKIADDFNGSGPRLGAELRVPLGSGFSIFGRGAASILFGKSATRFLETNVDGTELIADLDRSINQTVPVLDMALGIDMTTPLNKAKTSNLSLSAGYEYQHWFNVVNNTRFVNASNPGAFAQSQSDLSLQGFFLKAGLSFTF